MTKSNVKIVTDVTHDSKGVTLVVLVITIIVLLILTSVTITGLLGKDGLIKKTSKTSNKIEEESRQEEQETNNLIDEWTELFGKPKIPDGLEVGSEVTYNPSGTYTWKATYCSSTKTPGTDDVVLESGAGKNFNISKWKVLSIDEITGKVELVPNAPTTGTVYLGEAQGYNNGVKLLNDACSSLYGNTTKGIKARNINIEDIERYMKPEKLAEVHRYISTDSNTKYGSQVANAYTSYKNYPVIYAQEKLSVINGTKKEDGLGLSDSPEKFIERTEGTTSATVPGSITTATSIQPYQTAWWKDATYMKTAFKDYNKKDSSTANYYDLIMPKKESTTYWVASRCVNTESMHSLFDIYCVYSGNMHVYLMYNSNGGNIILSRALFPVVTLRSNLIEGDASTFSVKY